MAPQGFGPVGLSHKRAGPKGTQGALHWERTRSRGTAEQAWAVKGLALEVL